MCNLFKTAFTCTIFLMFLFFFLVAKNSQHNEADRIFIGRIGISVMYSYHKVLQWIKVYWTIEPDWKKKNESFLDFHLESHESFYMLNCISLVEWFDIFTCLPTILILLNCPAGSKHYIVSV